MLTVYPTGGDGVIRDIEFRIPVQVSILSERRVYHPYGLHGGQDAQVSPQILFPSRLNVSDRSSAV